MPIIIRVPVAGFLVCLGATLLITPAAAALECELSWGEAENATKTCNALLADNHMCLVVDPVIVSPSNSAMGFNDPEDTALITTTLQSIQGKKNAGRQGFTMLKIVTQGLDSQGLATPFTQAVVMVAFGETRLHGMTSPPPPSGSFTPQPICPGSMTPTASGQVTGPGSSGQIAQAKAIERFEMLGRSGSGDKILVKLRDGSTGWMDERETYLVDECADFSKDDLQVVDGKFNEVYLTPQQLQRAAKFSISSEAAEDEEALECTKEGFPPSGLLIFNPSKTELIVEINDVLLRLGSSALVGQYREYFTVLVLEGEVGVVGSGRPPAREGETLIVSGPGRVTIERGPSDEDRGYTGWCEKITRLALAIYTVDDRLRVPRRRLDFCRGGSAGYAVPPTMIVIRDPIEPRIDLRPRTPAVEPRRIPQIRDTPEEQVPF